jgi:hypothetical protein
MSVLTPGGSLRERFERFIMTLDGCESVDALLLNRRDVRLRRADYLFRGRSIIVEQKTRVADRDHKIQEFVQEAHRKRGMIFWGQRSTNDLFSRMEDGEQVKKEMFDMLVAPDLSP